MGSNAPATGPGRKKKSTRVQNTSRLDPTQLRQRENGFSPEEKCYLAHHVNQCYDFQDLCQRFNLRFDTDCTLEALIPFLSKCDDSQFFDLTEQAQDYRWCKPHSMSPVLPPSMVLGTEEWRTELRAFIVFHTTNNMAIEEIEGRIRVTFPEESRSYIQISTQLAHIQENPTLVRQLERFAARYDWHPSRAATASVSQAPTMASKAEAKVAARARLNHDKHEATEYSNSQAAREAQAELMR